MRLLAFALLLLALSAATPSRAQGPNRAGVVVQFGDGSVVTRCVRFSEESITGYELLRRARLPIVVEFGSFGAAICKIGAEGCTFPREPCFCQCQTLGAGCTYWVYSQLKDGRWVISGLGASNRTVRDGDVDGWAWGKGDGNTGVAPLSVTLDQICNTNAPTMTIATATLEPTPQATPEPVSATPDATSEPTALIPFSTSKAQTATPLPTATATPMATETPAARPSPTVATVASATSAPTLPKADDPESAAQDGQAAPNLMGYVVFGIITLGLVIGIAAMRRSNTSAAGRGGPA